MPLMSPIRYKLHLAKQALFGDGDIVYEVLSHHKDNLPNSNVEVSWVRDGEYIVGEIKIGNDSLMTQGRTAKEFVEMVNDTIYAAYDIPVKYAEALGGAYRITPSAEEFSRLNDIAVQKSRMDFGYIEVTA
ncbi:MAG: hypothetical protein V1738_04950 [Patescibacteria group bacterium]